MKDDYAFFEDGSSFAHQCSLFRAVRYGAFFVCPFFLFVLYLLDSSTHYSLPLTLLPTNTHRIIGVQSFKGSYRRTCMISPTLGEASIARTGQSCGGNIDPVTLDKVGYLQLNGKTTSEAKGYICPLGQICTVCVVLFPGTSPTFFFLFLRLAFWKWDEMRWIADHNYFDFEQEGANPQSNIESFDAIYYSVLQVVIVAGANGVSGSPPTHHWH